MGVADVVFTLSSYVMAFFVGWIVCLSVLDTIEHVRKNNKK